MLRILIVEFWPIVIPAVIYAGLMLYRRQKARGKGEAIPRLSEGPWFWVLISTFAVGIVCFMLLGASNTARDGRYVPAHLEDGKVISGAIRE